MLLFIRDNIELFLYLCIGNLCIKIGASFMMYKLYSKLDIRVVSLKKIVCIWFILMVIESLVLSIITIESIVESKFYFVKITYLFIQIIFVIIEVLLIKLMFNRLTIPFIFLLNIGFVVFLDILDYINESIPFYIFIVDNYNFFIKILVRCILIVGNVLFFYILVVLCSRFKIFDRVKEIKIYPKICYIFGILALLIQHGGAQLFAYANSTIEGNYNYMLYILFMLLAVIVVFIGMYTFIIKLKNNQMELVMRQQVDYITRLEGLQKELRAINHDYKNVAAGLYLQAEKGNIEEVKKYVNERLLQLDKNIQLNIRQINQLINVNHIELKSLLFTKAEKALNENVIFDIEVLNPLSKINMNKNDLLRCIGILLDNAIEESSITNERKVICSLLQEENVLTVFIKNSLENEINISSIYKNGFSTKGEGRGIGLYSLKQITKRYNNVFLKTQVEENCFIQVLRVS